MIWPRFTKKQRELLVRLESSPHGSLRYPLNCTSLRLTYEGMAKGETIISSWYTITQRGRDYVRFGMRARRGTE